MKVVIVGGHLSPALSIIQNLNKEDVYYIGRKHAFEGDKAVSLEYREISRLGLPFFTIKTGRLQRKLTRYTLFSLAKLPVGFFQALRILKKIKPDVVLSFGGYLSIPVGFAAYFLKIPLVLHEQTLEAGLANKILSPFAEKICISWESSLKYFPKEKTVLTGNPIKKEILEVSKLTKKTNNPPLIYVTGGSSGSHAINYLISKTIRDISKKYILFHQTGDSQKYKDFDKLLEVKKGLESKYSKNYIIEKFLDSKTSAEIIRRAGLVIGRSGINTVTELIYLKKPAILIPLPFSQKNEQMKNAKFMEGLGLAEVISQNLLTDKLFLEKLYSMFDNLKNYKLKNEILFENSSEKIINVLKDVSKKKTT
ncbi:MAG: UDP-N-acetylglucosamine--N-acetylmuramyl-(pentapeptide) pyrophosphoryl-undecaprenol N-acetylglucosamine transferase [Patescibacteria group bacterium]|nr:UDP-N-acetylglucosamine--N-acetylmuramyl-(pentapeptide) pyrophosphoryl-undecaprenol N-acetylglucosamine transferase [Patescibacteria group bacterium]